MRGALEKYESWRNIAQENQTEITKTITTMELTQMYYSEGEWHDAGDREISLVFTVSHGRQREPELTFLPCGRHPSS